jgi:hypothetical protein
MRTFSFLPALWLASAAFSLSYAFGSKPQLILSDNEALKVPGDNPLYYCSKPDGDILAITNVDLTPNPPEA